MTDAVDKPHTDEPKKRPAFQFYPADWRKDVELRSCSVAARGLWMDMLCIAHECMPYGRLTVNGKAMTAAQIAGQVGLTPAQCAKLLRELLDNGVARMTDDGVIYSKRMVDDERVRNARAEGGKAGADHGSKGAEHGSKGGRPKSETGDKKPPLPTPSEPPPSSSSSPSGEIPSEPHGSDAAGVKGRPKVTDPDEIIFGYGVPLLVNAGSTDKHARSFLAGLRKGHGDEALVDKLRECVKAKPLRPLEWLAAALPPKAISKHAGFATKDYREGINADGSFN